MVSFLGCSAACAVCFKPDSPRFFRSGKIVSKDLLASVFTSANRIAKTNAGYPWKILCRGLLVEVVQAKVPDESIPISPVLFDFDPALQVDLNLKELFELGSCLTGNPFQHCSFLPMRMPLWDSRSQ